VKEAKILDAVRIESIGDTKIDHAKLDCLQLTHNIKSKNGNKRNISYKLIKENPLESVVENYRNHSDISVISVTEFNGFKNPSFMIDN
jgi:tRNA A22 N-methylase